MIQKEWPGSSEKTRKNKMEESRKRDREGKKKDLSEKKDLQKSINRACTYFRKKSKLVPSISQLKVRAPSAKICVRYEDNMMT